MRKSLKFALFTAVLLITAGAWAAVAEYMSASAVTDVRDVSRSVNAAKGVSSAYQPAYEFQVLMEKEEGMVEQQLFSSAKSSQSKPVSKVKQSRKKNASKRQPEFIQNPARYGVHVATYTDVKGARIHRNALVKQGVIPDRRVKGQIVPAKTANGDTMQRVVFGPFASRTSAEHFAARMEHGGHYAAVIGYPELRNIPRSYRVASKSPQKTVKASAKPHVKNTDRKSRGQREMKRSTAVAAVSKPQQAIALTQKSAAGSTTAKVSAAATRPVSAQAQETTPSRYPSTIGQAQLPLSEETVEAAQTTAAYPVASSQSQTSIASQIDPSLQNVDLTSVVDGDMIMDISLDGQTIYQGLFCIGKAGKLYVPLSEVSQALEFPIEVASEGAGASGWYFSEDKTITLDTASRNVTLRDNTITLETDDIFVDGDEIYINNDAYRKIFPVTLAPDYNELLLTVTSDLPLPRQLRELRRGRKIQGQGIPLQYSLEDMDYSLVDVPRIDATASYGFISDGKSETASTVVAGRYRGDVGFLSSEIYTQWENTQKNKGKDESLIQNFNYKGERIFPDNPYVKKLQVGDVPSVSAPLLSSSANERTVRIDNYSPIRSSNVSEKDFYGSAMPGWDVELYHNNRLVDFVTIDETGRYAFEDVPLYYGENVFKIVIHGTEGQKEVKEESIRIGSGTAIKGEYKYELSVSEQETPVWDPKAEDNNLNANNPDKGKFRVKGRVQTGITDNINVGVAGGTESVDGEQVGAGGVELSGGAAGVLWQMNHAINTKGSNVVGASVRKSMGRQRLSASHSHGFGRGTTTDSSAVGLSGALGTKETPFSYSLIGQRSATETEDSSSVAYTLSNSISTRILGTHISNSLKSRLYEKDASGTDSVTGSLSIYRRFGSMGFRGSANYEVDPDPQLKNFSVAHTAKINDYLNTDIGMRKNLGDVEDTEYYGRLNWTFGPVTLFNKVTYDGEREYGVFSGISMSMDLDPHTMGPKFNRGTASSTGGASCFVYLDRNYNGVYDYDDEPIDGVTIFATQHGKKAVSNEEGIAYFPRLAALFPTDLELDVATLKDIRQNPSVRGFAIMPRVGKVYAIEFPVTLVGEIDGTIYYAQSDGANPKNNIPVELLNLEGEVVSEVRSEYDGYYLFSGVHPGEYTVRIKPSFLQKRDAYSNKVERLSINDDVDFVEGNNIFYGERNFVELAMKNTPQPGISDELIAQMGADNAVQEGTAPEGIIADATQITEVSAADAPIATAPTELVDQQLVNSPQYAGASPVGQKRLIIDMFHSERMAQRAVSHYQNRYAAILSGKPVRYAKQDDAFVLFIDNINSGNELDVLTREFTDITGIAEVVSMAQ